MPRPRPVGSETSHVWKPPGDPWIDIAVSPLHGQTNVRYFPRPPALGKNSAALVKPPPPPADRKNESRLRKIIPPPEPGTALARKKRSRTRHNPPSLGAVEFREVHGTFFAR